MCADGPGRVYGGLSDHNSIIMNRRRKTENLSRAWILLVQEHIINNDVVRHAVQIQ